MKNSKLFLMPFYAMIFSCFFSCMNYYKISKSPQNNSTPDSVVQFNSDRYFILRNGDNAYHMNNITISDDKKSLTCMLDTLPAEHKLHLKNGRGGIMRFKKSQPEAVVLNEIHLYMQQDSTAKAGSNYTLAFDKVNHIEVLEKNTQQTRTSYLLGGIGIALLVLTAFVVVAGSIVNSTW